MAVLCGVFSQNIWSGTENQSLYLKPQEQQDVKMFFVKGPGLSVKWWEDRISGNC